MNVNFVYVFEKTGSIAPESLLENDLWIDIGNTVKNGVFDHHQDGGCSSTFECIMKRPDCFEGVNAYLNSKQEGAEVVFHLHEYPDIDCLFSVFAIIRMIHRGAKKPAETFDERLIGALMKYVNEIDSGRGKSVSQSTLYAYFYKIGAGIKDQQKKSLERIEEGLKLIKLVVDKLEGSDEAINLFTTPLDQYIDVSTLTYYSYLQKDIRELTSAYQNDKNENRVIIKTVNLWNTAARRMTSVKAAIWKESPSKPNEYIIARDDGCILTVTPLKIKNDHAQEGLTRVIIALNPDMPESEEFSLLPLAEVIEQCEQIEEELLFRQTNHYRRDHSRYRQEGRFSETPFSETDDPWYVAERGDIVNCPRSDSLIPYDRIRSIIENDSSMAKSVGFLRYVCEDDQIDIKAEEEFSELSFGELYKKTREKIHSLREDPASRHLFTFVKIDSSMLKYNNSWLKACCLNMVGKSGHYGSKDNIFQIDYRTCLYTDQSITILVASSGQNQSIGSLIDENALENSRLCVDLKNVLEHQSQLRSIGVSLSETIQRLTQESEEIDRFNEQLVRLSTRMEEDDLITEPLEQEVYAFIKDALGIESLKDSVTTSAQLLIKNAEQMRDRKIAEDRLAQEKREKEADAKEEKRDGRIQAGIGLVTVFAIFSAWTDAFDFIAKFVPGSDGGWESVKNCVPVLIMEILTALFILWLGCVACKYVWQAWKGAVSKENDDENEENDEGD